MSNVDAVRSGHDAFNAREFERAAELLAQNGSLTDHARAETMTGREAFIQWMRGFTEMSSDIRLVDREYIDAGEHVTARFRATGVQDGPIPGFPASGKAYSLDVCEVWHFDSGGAADDAHNYSDGLGLLIQLGHIAPPFLD